MPGNFRTQLALFFKNPKDYIYCLVTLGLLPFKYSGKEKLEIYPYDPDSEVQAGLLIKEIKKLCPRLDIYLIGSIGLQIEGRGDIDLYAIAPFTQITETLSKITSVFGKPIKIRKSFVEWKFGYKGYAVELHVADPQDKEFKDQILLFSLLKNNREYLNEYRKLKNEYNYRPMREYVSKRMELFNRILLTANN